MTKKKKLLWCLLTAALLCLLLWRFLPRSIYSVLGAPKGGIHRAYVHVMQSTGEPDIHSYNVNTEEADEQALAELLTILEGRAYRPDVRNLLPWKTPSLNATGQPITVSVTLVWGNEPENACLLSFLKPEEFGISARWGFWGGFDVFHPADQELLAKLHAFAVQYGERQD